MSERRRAEHEAQKKNVNRQTSQNKHVHPLLITAGVCVFLVEIVWISFGSALGNGFVNFDDNDYVYQNPNITSGVTLAAVRWAFSSVHASNWHPLTTISHMLDCHLYGLQPWGHHLTNILLHAIVAILLFLALRQLTGRDGSPSRPSNSSDASENRPYENIWASAFVAALFAIHPLRVESVAWISERKDVLSGVFFMLTLWAYARYARSNSPSLGQYLAVIFFFALGLMCKPTLVTLPFLLLLLDHWPLGRWQGAGSKERGARNKVGSGKREGQTSAVSFQLSALRGLVVEKIPLFLLSAASCVVTIIAQKNALNSIRKVAFLDRLANGVISYVTYLAQTIRPVHLAVLYPYNEQGIKASTVIVALLLLVVASIAVWLYRKPYPFLLIGWLWFLGMLVPMSGIVQVGWQPRADRYTYLPQIGLFIATTWGVTELFTKWPAYRQLFAIAGLATVLSLIVPTRAQTSYWKSSTALWQHAVTSTPNNYIAYNNLGEALSAEGQLDRAVAAYEEAIRINNSLAEAEYNLANVFVRRQNLTEAIAHYQRALKIKSAYPEAEFNLGSALFQSGEPYSAIYHYERAVALKPDSAEMRGHLGSLLVRLGRKQEAEMHLTEAVRLKPDYTEAKEQLRELSVSSSP